MTIQQVMFAGRLTADPELRFSAQGKAVANLRVATDERIRQQDGSYANGESSFWTVSAFGDLAENVTETLSKGQLVMVMGKMKQRSYETKEGEKRTVYEVTADHIGPSLKWKDAPKHPSDTDIPF